MRKTTDSPPPLPRKVSPWKSRTRARKQRQRYIAEALGPVRTWTRGRAFQRTFRRQTRRFHEWWWWGVPVRSRKKPPVWVNSYQLTPIIASARPEIRGQNEPTLAC